MQSRKVTRVREGPGERRAKLHTVIQVDVMRKHTHTHAYVSYQNSRIFARNRRCRVCYAMLFFTRNARPKLVSIRIGDGLIARHGVFVFLLINWRLD